MTMLEILALVQVSLQVKPALNPLQFGYPPLVGMMLRSTCCSVLTLTWMELVALRESCFFC